MKFYGDVNIKKYVFSFSNIFHDEEKEEESFYCSNSFIL